MKHIPTAHLELLRVTRNSQSRSPKKYQAVFYDNKSKKERVVRFGLKGSEDYLMHKDGERRSRYLERHKKDLRTNDPTRPGYLSYWISWGPSTSLGKNVTLYREKLRTNKFPIYTLPRASSGTSKGGTKKGKGGTKKRSTKKSSTKKTKNRTQKGGKSSSGKLFVATIIFKRPSWTLPEARKWISDHPQYKNKVTSWKTTKSGSSYRAVLVHIPPTQKQNYRFNTKATGQELSFLFAIPK